MRLLALGDAVGRYAVECIAKELKKLKRETSADFVVINAENISPGNGTDPHGAQMLLESGADVLTGGNHSFRQHGIFDMLDERSDIIRPANFPDAAPGKGYTLLPGPRGLVVLVMNFIGQVFTSPADNPFTAADRLLCELKGKYDVSVADFHAEATSEKIAFAKYFDGRINIIFGTHTHVQTADERVLKNGTGYITDLGMCGDPDGVLGVKAECVVPSFVTGVHTRYETAQDSCTLCGALFDLDEKTKKVASVQRVVKELK